MNYPYLIEHAESYWIARYQGYCRGIVDKSCDLVDANWLKNNWLHQIGWESDWDEKSRIAFEQLVSNLLLANKVVTPELSE